MKKMVFALLPLFLAACSNPNSPGPQTPETLELFNTKAVITVLNNERAPLANAQVLIGHALNSPFSGNFLTTNDKGQVEIPENWSDAAAVTVQAPGYIRSTYMNQAPGDLTFQLRPLTRKTFHEVRGTTPQLPVVDKDGFIDFGMVMQAFTRLDLLSFDIGTVISPHIDKVTALGQTLEIPANLSVPKQSEKYGIFNVTLEKPLYRSYLGKPGINRLYAIQGRFPFKSTADKLRGGASFIEIINDISLTGGAIRDLNIRSVQTQLDLPTSELKFNDSKSLTAPTFKGDETFVAAGLTQQSGFMIPTDFKTLKSNEKMALQTIRGTQQMVLGILTRSEDLKNNGDRMSVVLTSFSNGLAPKMLPLINSPTVSRDELSFPRVAEVSGVKALATYSVFSKEEEVTQGATKMKIYTPQWEVYAESWVSRLKLPQWPNESGPSGKKRWEVNFIGSQSTSQAPLGPATIEAATHVTRSSISF